MMRPLSLRRMLSAIAALLAVAACASRGDAEAAARETAYQRCLADSMAVAMAWSAIEQSCRERADAAGRALDFYPPEED